MNDWHWTNISAQAESNGALATLNTPASLINLIFLASQHNAMWCLKTFRRIPAGKFTTTGNPNNTMKALFTLITSLILVFAASTTFAQERDPARWEEAMQAFDAMDSAIAPPANAIVLTGSSSIARWNDQASAALAPLTVIPRGFGGSTMEDLLFHLYRVALRYQPRAILIYEGDNDTAYNVPVFAILNQFRDVVTRIHEALPETRIYILAVKPSILRAEIWDMAQRVNAGYRGIAAQDPLVHYIDTATPFLNTDGSVMDDLFIDDNLHFNDLGNLIWGAVIRAGLMPLEARFEFTTDNPAGQELPPALEAELEAELDSLAETDAPIFPE